MTYATIHSLKFILIFSVILAAFFLFSFTRAHAYFTTSQEQIALGGNTGLFLIEYKFGMEKRAIHLPILAVRGEDKNNATLSYEILTKDGRKAEGKTTGIILSSTHLSEEMQYVTEKGRARTFTLAVFFTPDVPGSDEYRLQVTHLPFNFDGTQQLQLNPSELTYYTTKLISL